MRKKGIYVSFLVAAISLILSSHSHGPGLQGYDCTGSELTNNQIGCFYQSPCHGSAPTATINVSLELDSSGTPVTSYVAGKTYTIKLTGVNTSNSTLGHFGFQITCIKGTTAQGTPPGAGAWSSAAPANTHIAPPTSYTVLNIFEHSSPLPPTSGSGGHGTIYSESLSWTAPTSGTGAISFWGILNAVNGNGNADAGDLWNTVNIGIPEQIPGTTTTGINSVSQNDVVKIYPNPVTDNLNLQWENEQTGIYTISAYTLQGQNITEQNVDISAGTTIQKINTSNWAQGIYLVTVQKDETRKVFRVVKQ